MILQLQGFARGVSGGRMQHAQQAVARYNNRGVVVTAAKIMAHGIIVAQRICSDFEDAKT